MRFQITHADRSIEEREMSDCKTAEEAVNAVAGSTPGVVAVLMDEAAPVEPAPAA